MKPLEILTSIPHWAKATVDTLLSSPAWAMPCRLGEQNCTMRLDAVRPTDTLDLAIRLENEDHVLCLTDNAIFPELHAIWSARAEMPEAIVLALAEKDCGPLFQLLENALHRQLQVIGLFCGEAETPAIAARISADDADLLSFTLTASPMLKAAFGLLRYIDLTHPAVRATTLPAETEYASFTVPGADLAALAPGDAFLLPEVGSLPPRLVVDERFLLSEGGVTAWKDDGLFRVLASEPTAVDVGTLFDHADADDSPFSVPAPLRNSPLKLVHASKTIATGRLDAIGSQSAFVVDAIA